MASGPKKIQKKLPAKLNAMPLLWKKAREFGHWEVQQKDKDCEEKAPTTQPASQQDTEEREERKTELGRFVGLQTLICCLWVF
jgi:hypothetical protein